MKKVVIIGAGITGLSAAYHLQEKARESGIDIDYLVIEKNSVLGGKIVTVQEQGFLFEGGPDCFIREKPAGMQLATSLGITDKLLASNDASTGTYVLSNGKLHQLPDGMMLLVPTKFVPFALSPLISWPGKLRMALDLVLPKKQNVEDESLAKFVKRRLGQEALDKVGEPMIGGIHGSNSQTMSLRASFPRLLDYEKNHRSLIIAMWKARAAMPKPVPPKPGEPRRTYFMSFKGGMMDLIRGLEAKLDPAKLLTGTNVESVRPKSGGGFHVFAEGREPIEADAVILATPAWDSSEMLSSLDKDIFDTLKAIPQASSATINLIYHRKDVPGDLGSFGFVIPASEKRKINALTFSSVKWDYRIPSEEYVSVRTFVGGGRNQELAQLPADELIKASRQDLADILGITAEPYTANVHSWVNSRPQYVLGHLDKVKYLEDKLSSNYPGLTLAGASFRGIGIPDCITDGFKAAEQALEC